jgi:hypothetical protein
MDAFMTGCGKRLKNDSSYHSRDGDPLWWRIDYGDAKWVYQENLGTQGIFYCGETRKIEDDWLGLTLCVNCAVKEGLQW